MDLYIFISREGGKMDLQKNWRRILGLLLIVVMVYWGINNLSVIQDTLIFLMSVFKPFLIGGALAFILNVSVREIDKKLIKWTGKEKSWYRLISILLSLLIVGLAITAIIFLIIPDLVQTVNSFISVVPETMNQLIETVTSFIENNPNIVRFVSELDVDFNSIQKELVEYVQSAATTFLSETVNFVYSAVSSVVTVFIALVFAIYLLTQKEALTRQFKKLIYSIWNKPWGNYIVNVGREANKIFSRFVGAQLLEAFILGTFVYISMWIFDFPYQLSISVIIGTLALLPIYGAILGGIIGFILISVVSFSQAMWFIILIVIIQQIEGNLISPFVVGNRVGLPGVWVMFTVTVSGSLFGILGMLLSVPMTSLIYSLISAQVNYNLQQRHLKIETDTSDL